MYESSKSREFVGYLGKHFPSLILELLLLVVVVFLIPSDQGKKIYGRWLCQY